MDAFAATYCTSFEEVSTVYDQGAVLGQGAVHDQDAVHEQGAVHGQEQGA